MQTRPKVLIVLDLDYTHFITSKPDGVHWIGDKEQHLKVYHELIQKAEARHVEVIFAVVTSKTHFDDICEEAAKSFKSLLHRSNPTMVINHEDKEYVLVNKYGDHFYECLTESSTKKPSPNTPLLSHFHIVENCKVSTLLALGQAHNIQPENIIFLDDTEYKLEDAKKAGIKTVSYACFNLKPVGFFDHKKIISSHLEKIHAELFKVFDGVLQHLSSTQILEPVKEDYQISGRTITIPASVAAPQAKNKFMRLFTCCLKTEENEYDDTQSLIPKI